MTTWLQDINQLFIDAYAVMVVQRATLGLLPMQPASAINFQVGPEFLDQDQISPRIVIVPISSTFGFSQPLPSDQTTSLTRAAKSLYTGLETFEAHIWGDPDPSETDNVYSFNSTLELRREFLGALYTQMMGGRGPAGALTPISGQWATDPRGVGMINTYGRLYVLNFQIAMPVVRDAYIALPYAVTKNDGGVEREVTVQVTDPVTGDNPQSVYTVEIP